jgi:hypothetical protein
VMRSDESGSHPCWLARILGDGRPDPTAHALGQTTDGASASLAERLRRMNSKSCQRGLPECAAGFSARRDRKNDVDMMSNCQPSLRAIASVFGTLGDCMKPNLR